MQISNTSGAARFFFNISRPDTPGPTAPEGGARRASFVSRPVATPEAGAGGHGEGGVQAGRLDKVEARVETMLARLRDHTGHGGPKRVVGRIDQLVRSEIFDLAQTLGADDPELFRELRGISKAFREDVRAAVRDPQHEGGFDVAALAAAVENTFDTAINGLREAFGLAAPEAPPTPSNPARTAAFISAPADGRGTAPPVDPQSDPPGTGVDVAHDAAQPTTDPGGDPGPTGPGTLTDAPPLRPVTEGSGGGGTDPAGGADVADLLDGLVERFRGLLGELQGLGSDHDSPTRIALSLYAEFGSNGDFEIGSAFDLQS